MSQIERLKSLAALPRESEWCEFKLNDTNPEDIGEYISAIANSCTLLGRSMGYIVWGIEDKTHALIGTTFRPKSTRVGNEFLELWLSKLLFPSVDFRIHEFSLSEGCFVVFEIPAAKVSPVRFKSYDYIRIGEAKRNLKDFPEKERSLWAKLERTDYGSGIAMQGLSADELLLQIDYAGYFDLLGLPLPERASLIERLLIDDIITTDDDGRYAITNLGALLFAKNLQSIPMLRRKTVRVIQYKGAGRIEIERQQEGTKGYAVGFAGLVQYINDRLPSNEPIESALRNVVPLYPPIAIRELCANMIIHQDFVSTGAGPLVEIFNDRIEFTNPGIPLIAVDRFIDAPAKSRNERIASMMRRVRICEDLGSGIDRVVGAAELFQLPAPDFFVTEGFTRAILFAPKEVALMNKNDRIRACYQHAVLQWVMNQRMTNATFRKRMGIKEENSAQASRIISDTIQERLIKAADPESDSRRHAQYVPSWA